jgi:hypothetical protein
MTTPSFILKLVTALALAMGAAYAQAQTAEKYPQRPI